jgi:hypothetical protein
MLTPILMDLGIMGNVMLVDSVSSCQMSWRQWVIMLSQSSFVFGMFRQKCFSKENKTLNLPDNNTKLFLCVMM